MKEKPPSVEPQKESEQQPRLENLRDGTWAYTAETHESDMEHGRPPTPEEIVESLNEVLRLINKQGGRVVNTMEVDVMRRGSGVKCAATIIIVEKPKSKE